MKSKRLNNIGARLDDEELQLWEAMRSRVLKRNPLVDNSKLLRDLLFGNMGIVTDEDRDLLRAQGPNELLPGEGETSRYYMSQGNAQPVPAAAQTQAGRDLIKARKAAQSHQRSLIRKK